MDKPRPEAEVKFWDAWYEFNDIMYRKKRAAILEIIEESIRKQYAEGRQDYQI